MFAKSFVGLILFAGLVLAQEEALGPNGQPKPEPYSFSYSADSTGGVASHQETGDGTGKITGVYTIQGPDGRERRVEYIADAQGYRAVVKTNEIGTKPEDSGDARFQVSEPSEAQLSAANNANSLNPNSQLNSGRVAALANQRPIDQQQLSVDASANQARPATQQQQEQIPSANNQSPVAALAPGSAADEQQQTLVNLDDIQDQPPQDTPIVQTFVQQQQQPQAQIINQFAQPQGPLPTASFQPIAPAQPQQQLIIEQQQQQPERQVIVETPQQQVQLIEQAQAVAPQGQRVASVAAAKGNLQVQQLPQQQIFLGPQGPVAQQPQQLVTFTQQQQQPERQQQLFFNQQPQQPQLQLALQPVPVPTFAARQPQAPIVQVVQEPQQPQQFSQQSEQQQNEEADGQDQPQAQQPQLIAPAGPASGAVLSTSAAKGQQQLPQQQLQQVEVLEQPIGPGSAGQRGPKPFENQILPDNRFGPLVPQQPALQQVVTQPQLQQQVQFQPINQFGPLPVQQPQQQQQFIQQAPQPLSIIEQPQQVLAAPQPQLVTVAQGPVKGSSGSAIKGAAIKGVQGPARQQQQLIAVPAPQQQIIQRFESLPQQQFQPIAAPQPQFIQQLPQQQFVQQQIPQQQFVQQQQLPQQQFVQQQIPQQQITLAAPQRQPQLIQVPLEPEIQVPQVNIERIQPARINSQQPGALAVQPAAKGQQQQVILPTQGLRLEPIFKQVTVSAPQPFQPQQQQQQQQQLEEANGQQQEQQPSFGGNTGAFAKGQVEVISLKETEQPAAAKGQQSEQQPASEAGAADAGKTGGESDSDSQDNGSAQGQSNDSDSNNEDQQQQTTAPIAPQTTTTTQAPAPAPLPQRPAGRLVFGKGRFGQNGVKIGTKSAVAAAQPIRQQPIPQQQVLIAPVPAQAQIPAQPAPIKGPAAGSNQFISFGTRLGTKSAQ